MKKEAARVCVCSVLFACSVAQGEKLTRPRPCLEKERGEESEASVRHGLSRSKLQPKQEAKSLYTVPRCSPANNLWSVDLAHSFARSAVRRDILELKRLAPVDSLALIFVSLAG